MLLILLTPLEWGWKIEIMTTLFQVVKNNFNIVEKRLHLIVHVFAAHTASAPFVEHQVFGDRLMFVKHITVSDFESLDHCKAICQEFVILLYIWAIYFQVNH